MVFLKKSRPGWARLHPALLVLGIVLGLVAAVNRYAPRPLPQDPWQRLSVLQAAGRTAEAQAVYRELLAADPFNLDLHHAYLDNPAGLSAGQSEADPAVYYARLAADPLTADIGRYGLGVLSARSGDITRALVEFEQVSDRDQKYLNAAIASVYRQMGEPGRAEGYYQREIAAQGDLAGAVAGLAGLYFRQGRLDRLQMLAQDPLTGPHLAYPDRRRLALLSGRAGEYLDLAVLYPFRQIAPAAALSALLICVVWLLYFWRVDVFARKPLPWLLLALGLGGASALLAIILADLLHEVSPLAPDGGLHGLLFYVVHVGMTEELVKFLPAVLMAAALRRSREPFDLVLYGSLSALGFATLENALYFTTRGLGILFFRFLFSTVMHLSLTSILGYAWARARFIRPGNLGVYLLAGFSLAASLHGLSDFSVLAPSGRLPYLGILLLLLMAREYYRMIRNTLSLSPGLLRSPLGAPRLDNLGLLFSSACALAGIVFLYNHINFSTEFANQQLNALVLLSFPAAVVIFGSLGRFRPAPGGLVPLLAFPRRRPAAVALPEPG